MGGLLLAAGLLMLSLFTFDFIAIFALGIVPAVVGAAILWAGWRASSRRSDPEHERRVYRRRKSGSIVYRIESVL